MGRKAITAFTKRLTDEIFLFIERDPALLKEYKEAVKTYSAHSVNATLGKMIAEAYGLGNLQKESNPDSALLKRYTVIMSIGIATRKKRNGGKRNGNRPWGFLAEAGENVGQRLSKSLVWRLLRPLKRISSMGQDMTHQYHDKGSVEEVLPPHSFFLGGKKLHAG